jgi:hypothetical protein
MHWGRLSSFDCQRDKRYPKKVNKSMKRETAALADRRAAKVNRGGKEDAVF